MAAVIINKNKKKKQQQHSSNVHEPSTVYVSILQALEALCMLACNISHAVMDCVTEFALARLLTSSGQ